MDAASDYRDGAPPPSPPRSPRHGELSALVHWLFDFPQLAPLRGRAEDVRVVGARMLDEPDVALGALTIAEEVCDSSVPSDRWPASAEGAWDAVRGMLDERGSSGVGNRPESRGGRRHYETLRALLCLALSDRCGRQREYVGRIMAMGRPDVQQEIMRILQENAGQLQGGTDSDGEEVGELTADYSVFLDATMDANETIDGGAGYESEGLMENSKRERVEAFGEEHGDSPDGKKRHLADDEEKESLYGDDIESVAACSEAPQPISAEEVNLRAMVEKLQRELSESRKQEADLTEKADEERSRHRAEMLQAESKYLKMIRDLEDKYANDTSAQKKELEALQDCERNAKELKEENSKLRDELDVLGCSKQRMESAEEQLRKCKEKLEAVGDAAVALKREEEAHAASVDRCLTLETELAQLKPLKRQLEEYRVRATEAEVALEETREDLRRARERSEGIEGTNRALERGAAQRRAEAGELQRRLQEEGEKGNKGGNAVGVGMR